jgi:hypothetical protein
MDPGGFNGKKQVRLACGVARGAFAQIRQWKTIAQFCGTRGLAHVTLASLGSKKVYFDYVPYIFLRKIHMDCLYDVD